MSSSLEQLKATGTVVVCDSGDFATISKYRPQDATTNPSLILAAAKKPEYAGLIDSAIAYGKENGKNINDQVETGMSRLLVEFGKEILKIIPGRVSTEIDAKLSFNTKASVEKALQIVKLYEEEGVSKDRILIKIASTYEGIKAAYILQSQYKINCNLTLIFSEVQAITAAEAGVFLISPFVGRILDWYKNAHKRDYTAQEDPGVKSVQRIFNYYKKYNYETIVMGASFRNVGEIIELKELYNSTAPIPRKLDAASSATLDIPRREYLNNEAGFRFEFNEDATAVEKLCEGISKFAADTDALKKLLVQKIQA